MKKFKFLLILIFCLLQSRYAFSQNMPVNYSSEAIKFFNSGIALHKEGKYELAEQKYNQALKIQPNLVEAKKNLEIIYRNLAYDFYSNSNYEKSVYYVQKALKYKPNDSYLFDISAKCYTAQGDDYNAIIMYKRILTVEPDNTSAMLDLAQLYIKTNQLDMASELYNKTLKINPNDKVAQQNLKYINHRLNEQILNSAINNLAIGHIAPASLYRLIKPSAGITPEIVEKMKTILDLIWSEPNGQAMLQTILNKRIPINITQGTLDANMMKQQKQNTLYVYGFIPILSYSSSSISVNIPFSYILNFNNPNLTSYQRIFSLQVFIHEFGHTYIGIKNPNNFDSIEEELGVSMIGYNIAHKIITEKYLNESQTEKYSMTCLENLLKDDHRNLPIFSGFNKTIQSFGITMPYPYLYADIPTMYKKLLEEGKTVPVSNFNKYIR